MRLLGRGHYLEAKPNNSVWNQVLDKTRFYIERRTCIYAKELIRILIAYSAINKDAFDELESILNKEDKENCWVNRTFSALKKHERFKFKLIERK